MLKELGPRGSAFMLFTFILFVLAIANCSTLTAPLRNAETVEQKAFATYGTFVVFEELAAEIIQDPDVPLQVKLDLQAADRVAKHVVDSLLEAALEAQQVRLALLAGEGTEERLEIVSNNLVLWTSRAIPVVRNLVTAVNLNAPK